MEWKEIPGFPDYEISDNGSIRRATAGCGAVKGKILRQYSDEAGRLTCTIRRLGRHKTVRPSRLVAITFIGPPPFPRAEACHNNGNPQDNRKNNLRWDTCAGNKADMIKHRTRLCRHKHKMARLNPQQVRRIKERYAKGELQREIADRYGVKQGTISRIVNGIRWA